MMPRTGLLSFIHQGIQISSHTPSGTKQGIILTPDHVCSVATCLLPTLKEIWTERQKPSSCPQLQPLLQTPGSIAYSRPQALAPASAPGSRLQFLLLLQAPVPDSSLYSSSRLCFKLQAPGFSSSSSFSSRLPTSMFP